MYIRLQGVTPFYKYTLLHMSTKGLYHYIYIYIKCQNSFIETCQLFLSVRAYACVWKRG